ncbi:unnamed protein product [Victoria cruziana]
MSQRGRPRKRAAPAREPPREPAREDTEMAQTLQMLVASVQVLSNTMQAFMERQQPPQPQNEVPIQEARAVPPLPPVAPGEVPMRPVEPLPPPVVSVEPAEITAVTPTALQHKAFMGAKPPRFSGREGPDRAEEWLEEVEKTFDITDTPAQLWVRFGTFLLIDDAKAWWRTQRDIRYRDQQPTWDEFATQFRETYIPQVAREQRVREFLELSQAGKSVADYAARFRHLQWYCPHLFNSERESAGKFVWGLDEIIRPRVMSNDPRTLLQAVEMAMRMEADYRRSQALARRRGFAPFPPRFKKIGSTSQVTRAPMTGAPRRCLRCNRYHRGEDCTIAVVCYRYHQTGHYLRDYPRARDKAQSAVASSPAIPSRAPTAVQPRLSPAEPQREPAASATPSVPQRGRPAGRVYSTTLQELQSPDLIQGTLLLNEFFVKVLFDTGASHSFVARELARQLGCEILVAPFSLRIVSPLGVRQMDVEYIQVDCLRIEDCDYLVRLILLDILEFDIILGMDWLACHGVIVDCQKRRLIVGSKTGPQRVFKTQVAGSNSAHIGFLRGSEAVRRADPMFVVMWTAEGTVELGIDQIPVVREYADVFPDELPGLPPEREIEFSIELLPGVQHISKAPYRMAPAELIELKKQIQELVEKGFIQPSVSP